MTRAEKRRLMKNEAKRANPATYKFTKEQLDEYVQAEIDRKLGSIKQEVTDEAISTAMVLLFTLPMKVLMDHFWKKSYAQKIPKFTELLLDYYNAWENGELSMEEMTEDLWNYGGVRLKQVED